MKDTVEKLHDTVFRQLLMRQDIRSLLTILNDPGEETRLVGGCVRDSFLGKVVSDIDMATTYKPDEVARRVEEAGLKCIPTGIDHGTVTVLAGTSRFEITTLRKDIATDGRHAQIVFGRSFEEDAERRDFTINALSVSADGIVHDYWGGLQDLKDKKLRFIGKAETRIREDYLRILRFFRFSADYSDKLDDEGFSAAIRERNGLYRLSRERIQAEFLKILCTTRAEDIVQSLSNSGLLQILAGGIGNCRRFCHCAKYEARWQIYPDAIRRLAALCVEIREDVQRLRFRLVLSNRDTERLLRYAVCLEEVMTQPDRTINAELIRRFYAEDPAGIPFHESSFFDVRTALGEKFVLADEKAEREWMTFFTGEAKQPVFPLKGKDIQHLVARGPEMGSLLKKLYHCWQEWGYPADEMVYGRLVSEAEKHV